MSKSSGNVIDPLDVMDGISLEELHNSLRTGNLAPSAVDKAIEGQKKAFPNGIAECGADALRFGLLAYTNMAKHNSINLDIQVVVAVRQFGNKLWQATRFALLNFDEKFQKPTGLAQLESMMKSSPSLADRWIMHRLHLAIAAVDTAFKAYKMGDVTTAIRNFWLYDLCDVYLVRTRTYTQRHRQMNEDYQPNERFYLSHVFVIYRHLTPYAFCYGIVLLTPR